MRRHPSLILLLIALVVAAPVFSALTLETWTDGIYDAEDEYSIQATNSNGFALVCEPILAVGPILVVLVVLPIVDEVSIGPNTFAASDTRAPPFA